MKKVWYLVLANFLSSLSMGVVLIIIPWQIVEKVNSDALIFISILASVVLAVMRKKAGYLTDSMARGKLLAICMSVIAVVLGLQSLFTENTIVLLITFFCGQIYLFFYYVTRSSLIHEITLPKEYGKFNSVLEIENQVSTFVAGGLTAYFLAQNIVSEPIVLFAASLGLVLSALIITVKVRTSRPQAEPNTETEPSMTFPRPLMMIAMCSSVPFICVMLLNVIKPIIINKSFESAVDILAMTSVFYAVGAISAALLSNSSFVASLNRKAIYGTLLGFLLFCILPAYFLNVPVLYASSFAWGLFNSMSRIIWQTHVMSEMNNSIIGRFFTTISVWVDLTRISLLGLFWVLFYQWGHDISFPYLTVICLVGLGAFIVSQLETPSPSKNKLN